MRKTVTIELVGGVGNQLYGVALGRYLEETHDITCRFIMGLSSKANYTHGFTAHGWEIFGRKIEIARRTQIERLRLVVGGLGLGRICNVFTNEHGGLGDLQSAIRNGLLIRGYFQILAPWQGLVAKGLTEIRPASSKITARPLASLNSEIDKSSAFVHVRYGDYESLKGYAIDRLAYYSNAFSRLFEINPQIRRIFVFSDNREKALSLVSSLVGAINPGIEIFISSPTSHPLYDMISISFFSQGIIANSTFSLWGALLCNAPTQIIYPEAWFSDPEIPRPEIPAEWVSV
jgi:hypothetical protein